MIPTESPSEEGGREGAWYLVHLHGTGGKEEEEELATSQSRDDLPPLLVRGK